MCWLVEVVGRRWVSIWNRLIVLFRLYVVARSNIDFLSNDSTKLTLTEWIQIKKRQLNPNLIQLNSIQLNALLYRLFKVDCCEIPKKRPLKQDIKSINTARLVLPSVARAKDTSTWSSAVHSWLIVVRSWKTLSMTGWLQLIHTRHFHLKQVNPSPASAALGQFGLAL